MDDLDGLQPGTLVSVQPGGSPENRFAPTALPQSQIAGAKHPEIGRSAIFVVTSSGVKYFLK